MNRKPNTTCTICNTSIYRRPAELRETEGRAFCSMKCFGLSCRREVPCIVCGNLILGGLRKRTCSRKCANIHRAGILYRTGGKRDKVKSQRALKIRLLEERGARCERCRYNKLQILQVHHKDRNRTHNSLDNLELICPNCHCEEHYLEKNTEESDSGLFQRS